MAVNTMNLEDVYALINSLHEQATGERAIQATDTSSFISVANSALRAGVEPVYNAMMQVIGKTIFSVRPYEAKFKGIQDGAVSSARSALLTDRLQKTKYIMVM